MKRLLRLAVALILAALLTPAALANGTPIKIDLKKIQGITNFGSPNAKGTAEITVVEGDTKLTIVGLDRLTNELYQGWLVNTKTGERLSVGKFNTTGDGTAVVNSVVNLGNKEYDLFAVTVEPEPDPSIDADSRIALAGYWPKREPAAVQTAAANQTPGAAGATPGAPGQTPTPSVAAPQGLPKTGGFGVAPLLLALGGMGGALWILGREVRR